MVTPQAARDRVPGTLPASACTSDRSPIPPRRSTAHHAVRLQPDQSPGRRRPAYRRGDTGPAVAEIRAKLGVLGLLAEGEGAELLDPSGALFDEATDRAVRAFQQQRGISVDGVVGPQTYHALDEARWRLGDRILFFVPARLMAGDDVGDPAAAAARHGLRLRPGRRAVRRRDRAARCASSSATSASPPTAPAARRRSRRSTQLGRTVVGGQPARHARVRGDHPRRPGAGRQAGHHRPGPRRRGRRRRRGTSRRGELVYDLAARSRAGSPPPARRRSSPAAPRAAADGPGEEDRASFANAAGADLLISLHVEPAPQPRGRRASPTYYYGNDRVRPPLRRRRALRRPGAARDLRAHRPGRLPDARQDLGPAAPDPDAGRADRGRLPSPTRATPRGWPTRRSGTCSPRRSCAAVQRLYLPPDEDADTGVLRIPGLAAAPDGAQRPARGSDRAEHRLRVHRAEQPLQRDLDVLAPGQRVLAGRAAAAGTGGAAAPS